MIIAGIYSFKDGQAIIESKHANELDEVRQIIAAVDSTQYKTKVSHEKTKAGQRLYSPSALNQAFKHEFESRGWGRYKVPCTYSNKYYVGGFTPSRPLSRLPSREMDFVKRRLGVEVQFGKYAFMAYNVCAKMTIFNKLGVIDAGIEIVPVKDFAQEMSTGVSYFEQFVWDLENRGVADIDIPVLVIGVAT